MLISSPGSAEAFLFCRGSSSSKFGASSSSRSGRSNCFRLSSSRSRTSSLTPRQTRSVDSNKAPAVQAAAAAGGDAAMAPIVDDRPKAFGLMVCSASPAIAEAVAASGSDWLCIDAQHGAVDYNTLNYMLCATSSHKAKRIVRVGGPTDRFGIQQALDLGADGIMVPLVNSRADAEMAVSYCYFPPEGIRSAAYPVRAVYPKGVGAPGLARYLREANREVEVWLQVETKACFEAIDDVLSVPGVTAAFLGPADMGCSFGYHLKHDYNLPAMLASSDMDKIYAGVLAACGRHHVVPGVFCLGKERAAQLAAQGFDNIAYGTDTGALMDYVAGVQGALNPGTDKALEA